MPRAPALLALSVALVLAGCIGAFSSSSRHTSITMPEGELNGVLEFFNLTSHERVRYWFEMEGGRASACFIRQGGEDQWISKRDPPVADGRLKCTMNATSGSTLTRLPPGAYAFAVRAESCAGSCTLTFHAETPANVTHAFGRR